MCSDESRMVIYHCSVAGNLKSTSNIKLEDARDTTSHFLNATYQEQVPSRTANKLWVMFAGLSPTESNIGLAQVDRTVRHDRPAKVIISRPSYA